MWFQIHGIYLYTRALKAMWAFGKHAITLFVCRRALVSPAVAIFILTSKTSDTRASQLHSSCGTVDQWNTLSEIDKNNWGSTERHTLFGDGPWGLVVLVNARNHETDGFRIVWSLWSWTNITASVLSICLSTSRELQPCKNQTSWLRDFETIWRITTVN